MVNALAPESGNWKKAKAPRMVNESARRKEIECNLEVSSSGKVRHAITKTILLPEIREGRAWITFAGISIKVSHLVYWTFRGEIRKGWELHHHDGDRLNNRISNLSILTSREHRQLHRKGNPWKAKYPSQLVEQAGILLHVHGLSTEKVHQITGIDWRTVRHYREGDRRRRIIDPIIAGQSDFLRPTWNPETQSFEGGLE